jgi:hypothetical protein
MAVRETKKAAPARRHVTSSDAGSGGDSTGGEDRPAEVRDRLEQADHDIRAEGAELRDGEDPGEAKGDGPMADGRPAPPDSYTDPKTLM